MMPLYVRALYSAIKAYGPMPFDQSAAICAYIANSKLNTMQADLRMHTSSAISEHYLSLTAEKYIQICKEIPDVVGDEHLPYDKYFKGVRR